MTSGETAADFSRPLSDDRVLSRSFDELEVGARIASRGRTLTETDLVAFSALTGDWHPQHTDAVWAASTPFGERIAHGMLILSYAVGLASFDPRWVVAMRSVDRAVFKRPGKLGDTIRVEGRIRSLEPVDDERGLVGLALTIRAERATLAIANLTVVWRRTAPAA